MEDRKRLVALIGSEAGETDIERFRSFVAGWGTRTWHHGAPQYVDETDHASATQDGDEPVRAVGCVLRFPANAARDAGVEQASLADVEALIALLEDVSAETGLAFEFELDGEQVGAIEGGKADRGLTVGLVAAWRDSM